MQQAFKARRSSLIFSSTKYGKRDSTARQDFGICKVLYCPYMLPKLPCRECRALQGRQSSPSAVQSLSLVCPKPNLACIVSCFSEPSSMYSSCCACSKVRDISLYVCQWMGCVFMRVCICACMCVCMHACLHAYMYDVGRYLSSVFM